MQKILTIYTTARLENRITKQEEGLEEIRKLLDDGWHIVSVTPMGGAAMSIQQKELNRYNDNISLLLLGSVVVLSDEKNPICSI